MRRLLFIIIKCDFNIRFKDTVSTVVAGKECGLTLASFSEYEVDDEIECFRLEHTVKVR